MSATTTAQEAADFITRVRNAATMRSDVRNPMADAIEVALSLHQPGMPGDPQYPNLAFCDRCNQAWPCYEWEQVTKALLWKDAR